MTESALPTLPDQPVLRLTCPADLVETVPYVVGFHPTRSIVLICVRVRELRLTMRLDLPPSTDARPTAKTLAQHAVNAGADTVLIACYPDNSEDRTSAERMVRQLRRDLRVKDVTVKEAVRVENGRWWSYLCGNDQCCPSEGTPIPATPGRAAVTAVFAGEVALPDRSALKERLTPVNDIALIAVEQAFLDAAAALVRHTAEQAVDAWRDEEQAFLVGLAERYDAGGNRLTAREAGRALFALGDVEVRDACVTWWDDRSRCASSVRMWTDLVRHAPAMYVAPAATLLAGSAWLSGEGAFANIALDRALAGDPAYRLARLLGAAIQAGISPERFRATGRRGSGPAQDAAAD
jgi:hypothetical protein